MSRYIPYPSAPDDDPAIVEANDVVQSNAVYHEDGTMTVDVEGMVWWTVRRGDKWYVVREDDVHLDDEYRDADAAYDAIVEMVADAIRDRWEHERRAAVRMAYEESRS